MSQAPGNPNKAPPINRVVTSTPWDYLINGEDSDASNEDTELNLDMEMLQNNLHGSKHRHLNSPRRSNTKSPSFHSADDITTTTSRPGSPLAFQTSEQKTNGSPPTLILNPTAHQLQQQQRPRSPRVKVRKATQMLFERPLIETPKHKEGAHVAFQRIKITGQPDTHSEEACMVGTKIQRAMALRDKYLVPMPAENWGGLDPEIYSEFMKGKGVPTGGDGGPTTAASAVNKALRFDASTTTTPPPPSMLRSNKPPPLPLTTPPTTTASTAAPTPRTGGTARQRLRRRMDVPYNPYSKKLIPGKIVYTHCCFLPLPLRYPVPGSHTDPEVFFHLCSCFSFLCLCSCTRKRTQRPKRRVLCRAQRCLYHPVHSIRTFV